MSKLADRIRKSTREEPVRLGFATSAARAPSPTMLCIARVPPGKTAEAAAHGADAVIIETTHAGELKNQAKKVGETLIGIQPENARRQEIVALREAGADFVVMDLQSALAEAFLEEKVGIVLRIPWETEDTTLRLLGDAGFDAIIVPAPDGALTFVQLLSFRRVAVLTRTPLLAETHADSETSRLQVLRDSGVAGVILQASEIGKLKRLRETIAALPPRGRKRRDDRSDGATVPSPTLVASQADDDFDDDD